MREVSDCCRESLSKSGGRYSEQSVACWLLKKQRAATTSRGMGSVRGIGICGTELCINSATPPPGRSGRSRRTG
jgi:hypothetical protein